MNKTTQAYIYSVITAGGLVLAGSLASWSWPDPRAWAIYLVLALLAAVPKLRLPGMEGTYSLGFLFMLYGVAHFGLAETLVAACASSLAGSFLNTQKRSSLVQVLFNIANLAVSVSACFFIARVWLAAEMTQNLPAVIALIACTYFVINTGLVSGVLSLLQGKRLAEVSGQWYVWSFPYYLIGVALVGLLPSPGQSVPGEAWLALAPLAYQVHFFVGLLQWRAPSATAAEQPTERMPLRARMCIMSVVTAGAVLLVASGLYWQSENLLRFVTFLALAVVTATLKIRIPRLGGTLSPAFVLLLVAIAELSFAETMLMAAVLGMVQVLWRPAQRPMLAQVVFNPANMAVSAALAFGLTRVLLAPWLSHFEVAVLVVSTAVLYVSNVVLVSAVLALVNRKPLRTAWQPCYFWSLPYYLVGAVAGGIMISICRTANWAPSLLLLPLLGLVYVSYRVHVQQAVARSAQTEA
jgi:hypothetical protein